MTLRVAIVGAGPKGLYALERLVSHLRDHAAGPVLIDVFEPATPGAGPAYQPGLPAALLMNLRSDLVDAWPRTGALAIAEDDRHPGLLRWAARRGEPVDEYAPRAVVGAYLRDTFAQVIREGGRVAELGVRREPVVAVRRGAGASPWIVQPASGAPPEPYDEVLIATGHGPPARPGGFDARRLADLPIVDGMVVATRGFGLTTLDLVRLLEARGVFDRGTRLHAVSRSGRPPLAKPVRHVELELRARCSPTAGGAGWPPAGELTTAFVREVVVIEAIRVMAATAGTSGRRDQQVRDELAEIEARVVLSPTAAIARLRRSIEMASGGSEPDPAMALGVAWRAIQAAVVEHGSFGAFAPGELGAFRRLEYALELTGFGPPVASATSLLNALERGAVRVWSAPARLDLGGSQAVLVAPGSDDLPVDLVVDTVLPEPGVGPGSPLQRLLDDGLISLGSEGRGVRTDRDGTALRRSGRPLRGVAVIGRPTEDWVIGNDTLVRDTHDVAQRWGARVAGRATNAISLPTPTLAAAGALR